MTHKRSPGASRSAKYVRKLRKKVLEILGGKCVKCGNDDPRVLQIDHIKGGGTREKAKLGPHGMWRKILKDPEARKNYQLLCANCNWIKRYEKREHGGNPRPQTSLTERTATCQQCDKEFTYNPHSSQGKFCSAKCSDEGRNKVKSSETRRKMSEAHKGLFAGEKHPLYGKHHSKETREKMSRVHKRLWQNRKKKILNTYILN